MSWNDSIERKRFKEQQKKQAGEYRKLGMTEEQITAMHEFDCEQYRSNRRYHMHTQPLSESSFEDAPESCEDAKSPLLEKFLDKLSTSDNDSSEHSRYWWVEEVDDPELAKTLKLLSQEDLEIITLFAFDGYTQSEIAKKLGINQSNVSRAIGRIKKHLRYNK